MAKTTRYDWPTPNLSDVPDVPEDLSTLADAIEETVGSMDDRLTSLTGLSQSIFQYTTLTWINSTTPPTIPDSNWTAVPFTAVQKNLPDATPGFAAASPTRITCTQTGLYRLTGFAGFAMNGNGSRAVAFRVNGPGSSYPAISSGRPPTDIEWYGSIVVDCRVNKNDYMELVMRQTSGSGLKMDTVLPRFGMQRLI